MLADRDPAGGYASGCGQFSANPLEQSALPALESSTERLIFLRRYRSIGYR